MSAVVFDVGRVLIDFSYEPFREFLLAHGARVQSELAFFEQTDLLNYEAGLVPSSTFLAGVQSLLSCTTAVDHVRRAWQEIFSPIPEMLSALETISASATTILFSNTNELHWQYLEDQYQLSSRATGAVLSFEEKLMKPDPKLYQVLERRFGVSGESITYIDDRLENVQAAQSLGWRAIHHSTPTLTLEALQRIGLL